MKVSPEVKVGATILLSLVLLAAMALAVGQIELGPRSGYDLVVQFARVDGLRSGAPVRFAGVNVGKVSAIVLEPSQVVVHLRIERELPIPRDSRFAISTVGVLGDKHVEIHPGQAGQVLEPGSVVRGVDPVMLDSIIVEFDATVRNLNRLVSGISDLAQTEGLQDSIAESGEILKETLTGMRAAVDQINRLGYTVEDISSQIETFTLQLSQVDLRQSVENIEQFTAVLADQRLADSVAELHAFSQKLNTIPFAEISEDLSTFSQGLADFDFAGVEQEIRAFTAMMSRLDINPLIEELSDVTRQLASLDLEARSEELATFTQNLANLPLEEISGDLRQVADNIRNIPLTEISANVHQFSEQLAQVDISRIIADLESVSNEIAAMGWQDMATDVQSFTQQLAALDVEQMVYDVTGDFRQFSHQLNQIDVAGMFQELETTVTTLRHLSEAVEPAEVQELLSGLEVSVANVQEATSQFNQLVGDVRTDAGHISAETAATIQKMQLVVDNLQAVVDEVQVFVSDVAQEGETAKSLRATLANVEKSTAELREVIGLVREDVPLSSETFSDLRNTMDSIKKINEDIQTLKGIGDKVDVQSQWGLTYNQSGQLTADVRFEFEPEGQSTFYLVGWNELGAENHFQLQYGKDMGKIRQRYGLIDTKLGVGLDGRLNDQWNVFADLRDISEPKLRLGANYRWMPDWWMVLRADDIFRDLGDFSIGVERRF